MKSLPRITVRADRVISNAVYWISVLQEELLPGGLWTYELVCGLSISRAC